MRSRLLAPGAIVAALLSGCYTEGHSFFLGQGESKYFLSQDACEGEATATYAGGASVYSGYECSTKLLFFTLETRQYYDGKRTR